MITALLCLGLTLPQAVTFNVLYEERRLQEWPCIYEIFQEESSWNPNAYGDRTIGGSYGLPQRHAPAHGAPELPWPVTDQVYWTLEYADERYGGVCEGLEFRRRNGWW